MEGIVLGTLLIWGLTVILVHPLTQFSLNRALCAHRLAAVRIDDLSEATQNHWKCVAMWHYIAWDVLVLGTAGFIGGLMGYYFFGIAFQGRGWPGMLALIGGSFAGLAAGGGRF